MPAAIPAPSATRTRVERDTRRTYRRALRTTNLFEAGQEKGRERWRPLAARKDPTDDPINSAVYLLLSEPGLPEPGFCVELLPPAPVPDDGFLPCEPPELEPPIPPPLEEPPMPPLLLPPLGVPLIPPPDLEPPDGFEPLEPLELPALPGFPDLLGLLGLFGSLLRSLSRSAMVLPPIMKSMPGTDAPGECDLRLAASVPCTTKDIDWRGRR